MKSLFPVLVFSLIISSIIHSEEIRVLYNGNYYPLEFTNDRGLPDGFVIDLIYALARESALEVSFVEGNWREREEFLLKGEIDLAPGYEFSAAAKSIKHSKRLFSVPFSLLYRKTLRPSDERGLDGSTPIYSSGDSSELLLEKRSGSEKAVRTKNWSDAVIALDAGYGDYAIVSEIHSGLMLNDYSSTLAAMEKFELHLPYVLYTTKWHKSTLEKLNNGISIIRASGEFDRIYRKWFSSSPDSLIMNYERNDRTLIMVSTAALALILVIISIRKRKGIT